MKINLELEELEQLDLLLEDEISSNQSYLNDIKKEEEKEYYIGLIAEQKELKYKLEKAQIEENLVIQQYKAERENEILIDNYLCEGYDRMRDDELEEYIGEENLEVLK